MSSLQREEVIVTLESNSRVSREERRRRYFERRKPLWKGKKATEALYSAYQGDVLGTVSAVRELTEKVKRPVSAVMGRRKQRRRQRRVGKGRRSTPAALKPIRLPIKRVVLYSQTSGSQHRWYYVVPLSLITASLTDTFEEFKVINLSVKYVPNNAASETGLYTSVLLDRSGFGAFGAATAVQWFQYIGSMPGAVIKPRYQPTTHRWKPTEPSARDWIRGQDAKGMHLATIYICNNGLETEELGGLLDIRATLLARGRYWNAAVSVPPVFESPNADEPQPDEKPSTLSRTSSQASLVGGFLAL